MASKHGALSCASVERGDCERQFMVYLSSDRETGSVFGCVTCRGENCSLFLCSVCACVCVCERAYACASFNSC